MSNPLHVRRVVVQEIDQDGNRRGAFAYGILASDNYETVISLGWDDRTSMEDEIAESASILEACLNNQMTGHFDGADHAKIGRGNFYGKDWQEAGFQDVRPAAAADNEEDDP
jgi:hypothetical protein